MFKGTAGPFSAAPCVHRVTASPLPVIAAFVSQSGPSQLAVYPCFWLPCSRSRYCRSPLRQLLQGARDVRSGGHPYWPENTVSCASLSNRSFSLGCHRTSNFATAAETVRSEANMLTGHAEPGSAEEGATPLPDTSKDNTKARASPPTTEPATVAPEGTPPALSSTTSTSTSREAQAAAKAAAHAAYAASGGTLRTKRPPGMVKRSIAMHVGYVGTAFKGLQVNRVGAPEATVEEVLERAVYEAGLIVESNFGDLKKIKWTRNSRTDKGVHSLATVVGLRVLLTGDERFDVDPEGLEISAALNARLPPQVRVFSAQRVQKKFNARRFCFDRTYDYFLPAYLLLGPRGGPVAAESGRRDESVMEATSATAAAAAAASASAGTEAPGKPDDQHPHQQEQKQQHHHQSKGPVGDVALELQQQQQPVAVESLPGLDTADTEAALEAALAKLREALTCYVGTYPFHNYTAKRKTYVDTAKDKEARKAAIEAAAAAAGAAAAAAGEGGVAAIADGAADGGGASAASATVLEMDDEAAMEAAATVAAAANASDVVYGPSELLAADVEGDSDGDVSEEGSGAQQRRRGRSRAVKAEDDPLEEDEEEGDTDGPEPLGEDDGLEAADQAPSRWVQSCRWLYEKSEDKRDRVTVRHFRTITNFTADDPAPLVPGGMPCVRLRVRGMSFMLHQIRHMIGGALAVARGSLSMPLLRASLAGNARVTVPRAPPHTLILADCTFPPFRKAGADEARVHCWSGERLQLRAGGQRNLASFRQQSLDQALNNLLHHSDWQRFERCLPRFYWDPQAQEEVIRAHVAWEDERAERAKQREAEAAAAAAAATATLEEGAAIDAVQDSSGVEATVKSTPASAEAAAADSPAAVLCAQGLSKPHLTTGTLDAACGQ